MFAPYDNDNIFAKILRGELPCKKLFENDWVLCFADIHPAAPVHVLVIPKGQYICCQHFLSAASAEEITGFFQSITTITDLLGFKDNYKLTTNNGSRAGQIVPHFHMHILSDNSSI